MARPQHGQDRFASVGPDAPHLHPARAHDQQALIRVAGGENRASVFISGTPFDRLDRPVRRLA